MVSNKSDRIESTFFLLKLYGIKRKSGRRLGVMLWGNYANNGLSPLVEMMAILGSSPSGCWEEVSMHLCTAGLQGAAP